MSFADQVRAARERLGLKMVKAYQIGRGDVIYSPETLKPVFTVDQAQPAKARGYIVFTGKAAQRSDGSGTQTSRHQEDDLLIKPAFEHLIHRVAAGADPRAVLQEAMVPIRGHGSPRGGRDTKAGALAIAREYTERPLKIPKHWIVPDPHVDGVWLVRIDSSAALLINVHDGVDGVEEVEFDSWPPQVRRGIP